MSRDAVGQKNVCSNRAPLTDLGVSAHDGRTRVDRHSIPDGGVSLLSSQKLAGRQRLGYQAHALVHLDMVTNDAGLADHCPRAMVHEKVRPNLRARMLPTRRASATTFDTYAPAPMMRVIKAPAASAILAPASASCTR